MYLRHTTIEKNGKTLTYWRVVRSVRKGAKVFQETVAQLGELDAQGHAKAKLLARTITGRDTQQRDLFESAPTTTEPPVKVRLDRVRVERGLAFGDVWLGWTLWRALKLDEECARCAGPNGKETFVLCRSAERRKKEEAMHQKFATRIEEALQSLKRRLDGLKKKENLGKVERQIGRLFQRNARAAAAFDVKVAEDSSRPCGLSISWSTNVEWKEWASTTEGCYILRTNITDWTPETLWSTYIQLTQAEAAFRVEKSELSIRPIWHQKEHRVQAHIFVCFLAHVLWKTLEQWQSSAGLGNSPRTILEELRRIQTADIILPTAEDPARELRIRCVVRPDRPLMELLNHLGLRLPERLRIPNPDPEM